MKPLKPRHERFCRHFVECVNASSAARAAGYAPGHARNAGYRLLRHPRIAERIAEIQRETALQHCSTVDMLLGKLETIFRRAVNDHHFSAAARAVELQAKLAGMGASGPSTRARSGSLPPVLPDPVPDPLTDSVRDSVSEADPEPAAQTARPVRARALATSRRAAAVSKRSRSARGERTVEAGESVGEE